MSTERVTNTTAGLTSHELDAEPNFVLPLPVIASFYPLVPSVMLLSNSFFKKIINPLG